MSRPYPDRLPPGAGRACRTTRAMSRHDMPYRRTRPAIPCGYRFDAQATPDSDGLLSPGWKGILRIFGVGCIHVLNEHVEIPPTIPSPPPSPRKSSAPFRAPPWRIPERGRRRQARSGSSTRFAIGDGSASGRGIESQTSKGWAPAASQRRGHQGSLGQGSRAAQVEQGWPARGTDPSGVEARCPRDASGPQRGTRDQEADEQGAEEGDDVLCEVGGPARFGQRAPRT